MSDQITEITMPRLSDSMQDGTILSWLKAAGDAVQAGEELLEIETDKATMAYESPAAGVLTIVAQAGETLPVGALIATLGDRAAGAAEPDAPAAPAEPEAEPQAEPAAAPEPEPEAARTAPRSPGRACTRPDATGHARRRQRLRPGARSAPPRSRAVSPAPTASTSPRCGEPGPAGGSPAPTSPPTPA